MAVLGTPEPRSPKIVEEPMAPHMTEDTICVAVGDIVMKSRSTLAWALQKSRGKRICILHVHQPAETIPLSKSAGTYTFSHFHTQARKFKMFFFFSCIYVYNLSFIGNFGMRIMVSYLISNY